MRQATFEKESKTCHGRHEAGLSLEPKWRGRHQGKKGIARFTHEFKQSDTVLNLRMYGLELNPYFFPFYLLDHIFFIPH